MSNATKANTIEENLFAFATLGGSGFFGLLFYGAVAIILVDLSRQVAGFRFLLSHVVVDMMAMVAYGAVFL